MTISVTPKTAETLIRVDHIWKKFGTTIPANRRRLNRAMLRSGLFLNPDQSTLRQNEFWSLKDLSFRLTRGEALGLIGRNGVLGGHMRPDLGEIEVHGRVSELIALTSGYQPLLSGKENILIGAAIRGLTKEQTLERLDRIIDFSEIREHLDAPFGTYSQGMKLRLAFSVAVHVDPDVLLIDEVIGVGDYGFRQKCMAHLETMRENCAIILCTHNTGHLAKFCNRVIVLDKGETIKDGDPRESVAYYLSGFSQDAKSTTDIIDDQTGEIVTFETSDGADSDLESREPFTGEMPQIFGPTLFNQKKVREVKLSWNDKAGNSVAHFRPGENIHLNIHAEFLPDPASSRDVTIGLQLFTEDGTKLARMSHKTELDRSNQINLVSDFGRRKFTKSRYYVVFRLSIGNTMVFRHLAPPLMISQKSERWGQMTLPVSWVNGT